MTGRLLLNKWTLGAAASLAFIWLVGGLFLDRVAPKVHDPVLGSFVHEREARTAWRSEGWADTTYGPNGLTSVDASNLASHSPKVILWGDSMVEALQVPESRRTMPVFSDMMRPRFTGFAVGGGGKSMADYLFDIPRYERLVNNNIRAHVILITDFADTLPGRQVQGHAQFLEVPLRLIPASATVSSRALRYWPLVHRFRLDFLYYGIYTPLKEHRLRFAPGKATASGQAAAPPPTLITDATRNAWRFLLQALQETARADILIVHAPPLPRLENGSLLTQLPEAELVHAFRDVCTEQGVDFVDMTEPFLALHREQGCFPHGFSNTPPGTGHLNEHGHRRIAEALAAYFRERSP